MDCTQSTILSSDELENPGLTWPDCWWYFEDKARHVDVTTQPTSSQFLARPTGRAVPVVLHALRTLKEVITKPPR